MPRFYNNLVISVISVISFIEIGRIYYQISPQIIVLLFSKISLKITPLLPYLGRGFGREGSYL